MKKFMIWLLYFFQSYWKILHISKVVNKKLSKLDRFENAKKNGRMVELKNQQRFLVKIY